MSVWSSVTLQYPSEPTSTHLLKSRPQTTDEAYVVYDRDELIPYKPYRKLYGERKYQRPQKALNLSFMDLPVELRIKIYKCVFVLPQAIELWPETGHGHKDYWQRIHDRKVYRRIFNRRNINLGLLRVCKQVNEESAQVFYGQNEFRFSGTNGCIVAAAFLYTIKPRNTHWLTRVTIAMPFRSLDRSRFANQCNPKTDNRFSEVVESAWACLRYPQNRKKWWSHCQALRLIVQLCREASGLKKLTLVLPDYLQLYHPDSDPESWAAFADLIAEHPGMEMEVVSLWETINAEGSASHNHAEILEQLGTFAILSHVHTVYESRGRWTAHR